MENKRIKEKFIGEDEDGGHRCSSRRTSSGADIATGKCDLGLSLAKN